ncbi:hypothetical protein [Chroococcidiopsis sp. CCALA 051]|nr:hypothetical protein [Chroococcidiopsis sp. CCALA 051]
MAGREQELDRPTLHQQFMKSENAIAMGNFSIALVFVSINS